MYMLQVLVFLVVLLACNASYSATYQIDASAGDDANPCTASQKCRSVERLLERTLAAGDILEARCNDYYREDSTISPLTSGTSGARITFRAYGPCYEKTGVHTGVTSQTRLTETNTNFVSSGVLVGHTVFNLTRGASCNVSGFDTVNTTNDTLVCAMGLGNNRDESWIAGDAYLVNNEPKVSGARLFSSGWTETNDVWRHAFTLHPGRLVWFNGKSTIPMMHNGTCNQSSMEGASDGQYCAQCTGTNNRDCGPGTLYVKSATNPATRWTNPGVEVVDQFEAQSALFNMTRAFWTFENITIEKVYGTLIDVNISNFTFRSGRLGWPQRKNCHIADDPCHGNEYPWQQGMDDRGGTLISLGGADPQSGHVIETSVLHDCENNCINGNGSASLEATIRFNNCFNNEHSFFNSGFAGGDRDLNIHNNTFHGNTVSWDTGNIGSDHSGTVFHRNLIHDAPTEGDTRTFRRETRVDPYNIFVHDPTPSSGFITVSENVFVTGNGPALRVAQGNVRAIKNIIWGSAHSGIGVGNDAGFVRLNDNIIADNGSSGTLGATNFAVGCAETTCNFGSGGHFRDSNSNNNKFRSPSHPEFGFNTDGDVQYNLSGWQTVSGNDAQSVDTVSCFISPNDNPYAPTANFNLAPGCNDIAVNRGPFRELTFVNNATLSGTTITTNWTIGGQSPLSGCKRDNVAVTFNGVEQTVTCSVSGTTATITIPTVPAGTTVVMTLDPDFVQDSVQVGGWMNARSRAFNPVTLVTGVTPKYAAPTPTGTGTTCTQASPCTVATALGQVAAGGTVNLLDGTYQGATSMITLPAGKSGTSNTNRITIRAINDGAVLIDGQNARGAVVFNEPVGSNTNNFITIEGINAKEGTCNTITLRGNNNQLKRVMAWDANTDENEVCHPLIVLNCTDCLVEDTGAFGTGWRTMLNYESIRTTFRRVWSRWNNADNAVNAQSDGAPGKALETSYLSHETVVENGFITRSKDASETVSATGGEILGIGCVDCGDPEDPLPSAGTEPRVRIYGSMVYFRNVDVQELVSNNRGVVWDSNNPTNGPLTMQDFVVWLDTDETTRPIRIVNAGTGGAHVMNRVTTIGQEQARISNTNLATQSGTTVEGYTLTNHKAFTSIAQAGANLDIWDGPNQANLCFRYVNGVLTTTPLWPWPMNDRINAALVAAGRTVSASFGTGGSLQGFLEQTFGTIPAACKGGVTPPPPQSTSCDHYAGPAGLGTACTQEAPCTIEQAENTATCGQMVCLLDGLYQGATQTLNIATLVCDPPRTFRCVNDGGCHLHGQGVRRPIFIDTDASGVILEGINASDSSLEVVHIRGQNVTLERMVTWNAGVTGNAVILSGSGLMPTSTEIGLPDGTHTSARDIVFDTVAAFGRGRMGIQMYQTERSVVRNSLVRWMCTGEPQPKAVMYGFHARDALWEDNLLSWDEIVGNCTPVDSAQKERIIGQFREARWNDDGQFTCLQNYYIGNMLLVKQADIGLPTVGLSYDVERCARFQHNVAWVEAGPNHTGFETFALGPAFDGSSPGVAIACGPSGSGTAHCQYLAGNNTAIHNGNTPNYDADWVQSNNVADASPRDVVTNPWLSTTGANLCFTFVNGVRTSTPRWPWPLNQRLINSMVTAGYTPYDVHAEVQAALGVIPQLCLRGSHEQTW